MTKNSDISVIMPGNIENYTEPQFQRFIIEIASLFGFTEHHHQKYSIGSKPGLPDLLLVNPVDGGVVYIEVKGKNGKPLTKQVYWTTILRAAGVHAYIMYPKDAGLLEPLFQGELLLPEIGSGNPPYIFESLVEPYEHLMDWG